MKMNPNQLKDAIAELLPLCELFKNVLFQEYDALQTSNPGLLIECIDQKQDILHQLFEKETQIRLMLNIPLTTAIHYALRSAVQEITTNELKIALEHLLDQLIDIVEICKSQNQLNGAIINNNLELVKRFTQLLKNQSTQSETYNEKGQVGT